MDDLDPLARELATRILGRQARIPTATYRLQFNRSFTFAAALEIAGYLCDLGVSDLYASPIFCARPDSLHGYDITDHNRFNPAIGTREEFARLSDKLRALGMGLVLDVVPNHMGIGAGVNVWWNDVLENGPSSRYARYFDVAWRPIKPALENKVLLPFLGDHYGRVLERGELSLRFDRAGHFALRYWETELPVNPRTYIHVLEPILPELVVALGEDHDQVLELQSIITGLSNLPPRTETRRAKVIERGRE